jgi:hypothetical protein
MLNNEIAKPVSPILSHLVAGGTPPKSAPRLAPPINLGLPGAAMVWTVAAVGAI